MTTRKPPALGTLHDWAPDIDEARWQLLETPDDITAFVEALSSTNKRASPEKVGLFYWC